MHVINRVLIVIVSVTMMLGLAAPAFAERYVSIAGGRAQFSEGFNCKPIANSVTVMEVAKYAKSRGITDGMGANLIPGRWPMAAKSSTGHYCEGNNKSIVYMNLQDAKTLQKVYGWRHSTSGLNYKNMYTLSPEERRREACGARDALKSEGFVGFHAIFSAAAPGGTNLNDAAVKTIQGCGFIKVRDYGQLTWNYQPRTASGERLPVNVRSHLHPKGYYRSWSVNGGDCPVSWQCLSGDDREYIYPGQIIRVLKEAPNNSHAIIQYYRFVEGDSSGKWKCTGRVHRTYAAETYCWNDFKKIIDYIAASRYVAASPLRVFNAWGIR